MFAFIRRLLQGTDHLAPLKQIMPELNKLDEDLRWCWKHSGSPLHGIVEFFDIVSKWHDRELNATYESMAKGGPKYAYAVQCLKTLCTHFANAGRSPYGWNRTQPGETVTADKVFLGDIFGLMTKPVSYWITLPVELKKNEMAHPAAPGKSPRQLVETQARNFMEGHILGISAMVDELERCLLPEKEQDAIATYMPDAFTRIRSLS